MSDPIIQLNVLPSPQIELAIADEAPTIQLLVSVITPSIQLNISTPSGPSTPELTIENEVPTGLINGSNATFTTLFDFVPETVEVFVNGLAQIRGVGFITTGTTIIVLSVSPDIGDTLFVNYQRS